MEDGNSALVDEIEATVKGAAGESRVLIIRLMVGKSVTVPKVDIASQLHAKFPGASVEIKDGKQSDAVVVKDIEIE
jgi:hypothetical protein